MNALNKFIRSASIYRASPDAQGWGTRVLGFFVFGFGFHGVYILFTLLLNCLRIVECTFKKILPLISPN